MRSRATSPADEKMLDELAPEPPRFVPVSTSVPRLDRLNEAMVSVVFCAALGIVASEMEPE
jgi:hypothetical protein